jgi:hypothetical protein
VFKSFRSCSLKRSLEPVKHSRLLKISQSHLDSRNVNLMIKRDAVSRNLFPSAPSPCGCFIFYSHNFTPTVTHNIYACTVVLNHDQRAVVSLQSHSSFRSSHPVRSHGLSGQDR